MKIVFLALERFRFEVPAEMYRLAVVGTIAILLATAVIESRNGNVAAEDIPHGLRQAFQQPKDREQAGGRFIPIPKVAEASDEERLAMSSRIALPRRRPATPAGPPKVPWFDDLPLRTPR